MKTLVIYDSTYGNTENIARAIGRGIGGDVEVLHIGKAKPAALEEIDFLFIGSPTQGGRATQPIRDFIESTPEAVCRNLTVASFDTRISAKWVGIFGYAAGKIAQTLKSKGARLVAPPEPFFVSGKEGPLKDGELERAARWAKETVERQAGVRA